MTEEVWLLFLTPIFVVSLDLRLPADVQQRLRDVSKRLGLPPSDLAARALRSYFRDVPGVTLREKARRQSLRARRADREDAHDEITPWEESADTSGWTNSTLH